jgi:hypothetical protein
LYKYIAPKIVSWQEWPWFHKKSTQPTLKGRTRWTGLISCVAIPSSV